MQAVFNQLHAQFFLYLPDERLSITFPAFPFSTWNIVNLFAGASGAQDAVVLDVDPGQGLITAIYKSGTNSSNSWFFSQSLKG